jgi:DNA-binding CsgD family transcriptional regulator
MGSTDRAARAIAEALVGREPELELIGSFLDAARVDGGVLLLSGEAGVGKTVLLDAAGEAASRVGTLVLRAAGVEFEADVALSALNQLLLPLQGEFERLGAAHRDALVVALGFGDGPAPSRQVVSTATLQVLQQVAASRPLLVIVDDVQWLDRPSAGVLGFVARRVAGSRIGFLAAWRSGTESFFEGGGLPEHELQPLDDVAARQLVRMRFPSLAPRVVERLLSEAEGNPLALLELPGTLSGPQRSASQALPTVLPLSGQLQRVFAARVRALPPLTRRLLLLAALDGTGDLRVLHGGGSDDRQLTDLAPAEEARLVQVNERTGPLVFRHPLIRSAVVDLSTIVERRQAHRDLAERLVDEPDRHAWHLAQATVDPDEAVAGLLEQTARRALHRGEAGGAVAALLRAADLSPTGADRARRLATAAYIGAAVAGDLRNVSRLLDDARQADPTASGTLQAAAAAAFLLLNSEGDVETAHRLLVGAIETQAHGYDAHDPALIAALHTLLLMCFFGGGRPELSKPVHAIISRLTPRVPEALSLCATTFADPARATADSLARLDATIDRLQEETDPAEIMYIAMAAAFVDRLGGCREALWRVVQDGRQGGAIASAIRTLFLLSLDDLASGRWKEARQLADEGLQLCDAHGYRLLAWAGKRQQAVLAAACGDDTTVRTVTDEMLRWSIPRGALVLQQYAHEARGLAALGRADFEEAYHHTAAISPPGILAPHVPHALWVALDLVEAAVRTHRPAQAIAHVNTLLESNIAALSSRQALLVGGAAAMAAPDDRSLELFDQTLAAPGVNHWPFEFARVQLAYGERLRRARATAAARGHLTAAVDTFRHLGAEPWLQRAGSELRATGQTLSRPNPAAVLTPQEREIAMLAASGLSNKEIADRLFLSHRTVGAHLYKVFPKLGITSRAALRDALASLPPEPPEAGN